MRELKLIILYFKYQSCLPPLKRKKPKADIYYVGDANRKLKAVTFAENPHTGKIACGKQLLASGTIDENFLELIINTIHNSSFCDFFQSEDSENGSDSGSDGDFELDVKVNQLLYMIKQFDDYYCQG